MTFHEENFKSAAKEIATNLRRMADRIDFAIGDSPDAEMLASEIVHTVMWGMTTLNLDGLIVKLMRIMQCKEVDRQ